MNTDTLWNARRQKQDEYYTQLPDIERELKHYKTHFRGKVVYCNCDDPYESNFVNFFAANFNAWGLKKLIATCYSGSRQLSFDNLEAIASRDWQDVTAYKLEITSISGSVGMSDVELLLEQNGNTITPLTGNGDFRSPECIALLDEADIVVTNPPFSLFRQYMAQLVEHEKQFLIMGNHNAITYTETFPLIQDGRLWLGVNNVGTKWFRVPKIEDGIKYIGMNLVNWFTNLDHGKRQKELLFLWKNYTPDEYPMYDNYEAINVDKVADIPDDYNGVMGVPLTFIDKHNPDQFEIVCQVKDARIGGEVKFDRIMIRRKQ